MTRAVDVPRNKRWRARLEATAVRIPALGSALLLADVSRRRGIYPSHAAWAAE